jgi:hypothetical protein
MFFPIFIYRKSTSLENDLNMRKSPGHIPYVRALGLFMCKENPLKLYQIKCATELIKWFLKGRLVNMMFFPEIYIEKEQITGVKNDQATRKYPGHITWVRALSLFICKEDPLQLYKIEFALELVK